MKIVGPIFWCGDYVNTDVMAPGRFEPIEGVENLARIAMIDYESPVPFINQKTNRSDFRVIVAGRDFGCGSSRETATLGIFYAGVKVIIAKSFGRIFYRNCVNTGIYPLVIPHEIGIESFGKEGIVDIEGLKCSLNGFVYNFSSLGPLHEIIQAGGLSEYTRRKIESSKV